MLILALLFLVGDIDRSWHAANDGDGYRVFTGPVTTALVSKRHYDAIICTDIGGLLRHIWRRGGQTLGMQTWRLKTINDAGQWLTWGQSLNVSWRRV